MNIQWHGASTCRANMNGKTGELVLALAAAAAGCEWRASHLPARVTHAAKRKALLSQPAATAVNGSAGFLVVVLLLPANVWLHDVIALSRGCVVLHVEPVWLCTAVVRGRTGSSFPGGPICLNFSPSTCLQFVSRHPLYTPVRLTDCCCVPPGICLRWCSTSPR